MERDLTIVVLVSAMAPSQAFCSLRSTFYVILSQGCPGGFLLQNVTILVPAYDGASACSIAYSSELRIVYCVAHSCGWLLG